MSITDSLVAALRERFGTESFRAGSPPAAVATFPAKHPAVGGVTIKLVVGQSALGSAIMAEIGIGEILADHFTNFDAHLDDDVRCERLTKEVVRFLDALFSDRLLLWESTDGRHRRGWREWGELGCAEPLVMDNATYQTYLWSGPTATWRAIPSILARAVIRNRRDYELLAACLDDTGLNAPSSVERAEMARLMEEFQRQHPDDQ